MAVRNRPRRRLRATAGLTAGALILGVSAVGSAQSAVPVGDGQPLDIATHVSLMDAFNAYAEAYNATGPAVPVTVRAFETDIVQQLVTERLSGDAPDIIFDAANAQFQRDGVILDLTPWLEEGKDGLSRDQFVPSYLDSYISDPATGAIGGIPVSADTMMLFYNKDLFEKAGVTELPTADWTWDDMYRVAKQISDAGQGEYYGYFPAIWGSVYQPVLHANGTELYDPATNKFTFANEAGLATWELLLRPYVEGFGTPYQSGGTPTDYFAAGQAAMYVGPRPVVAGFREALKDADWDVQVVPKVNGQNTVGAGSYGLSIMSDSDKQEAAWKFLAWFYDTDGGQQIASQYGVVPATFDGIEGGSWRNDTNPVPANLTAVTDASVPASYLGGTPPPVEVIGDVDPALTRAMEEVLLGGKTVQEAYTAAQDELNATLE
jgi:multiple sugar transport system substrate-binding protein